MGCAIRNRIRELRGGRDNDPRFGHRMLLAEANQWPADAAAYFGDGDECHMAFHFPLMPRMYMAIAQEDRHPLVEIMGQTPDIPDLCQWAIFLRNHDELTLEMVTDEERDYMYRAYAGDERAREVARERAGALAAARLSDSGVLDPAFSGDGKATFDLTPGVDLAAAVETSDQHLDPVGAGMGIQSVAIAQKPCIGLAVLEDLVLKGCHCGRPQRRGSINERSAQRCGAKSKAQVCW